MAFNYMSIAAKDRVLYKTYDSIPDVQLVSASIKLGPYPVVGPNTKGFAGYVGARQFFQISLVAPGVLILAPSNVFSQNYRGVQEDDQADGVFLDRYVSVTAQLCVPGILPSPGSLVVGGPFIFQAFRIVHMVGNNFVDFPADSIVHINVTFTRNREAR